MDINSTNSIHGRRITVTGGAGFLGSFVVEQLTKAGAEVFIPQIEDYNEDLEAVANPQHAPHHEAV